MAVAVVLGVGLSVAVAAPAQAEVGAYSTVLCKGYSACASYGMTSHGYDGVNKKSYWRMYGGHNCTNYAAYLMVKAGHKNVRPWTNATGNAAGWGVGLKSKTNTTPTVGSIAWWTGGSGHVAYVEAVLSPTEIVISEDSWGGDFYWRIITKANGGWPKGFIHIKDSTGAGSVPDFRAKPTTTTVWLDSSKQTLATTTVMNPGRSYWVEQSYLNTGRTPWTGLELAALTAEGRDSTLAANGWTSPTRAAVQKQALVPPGGTATFAFAVRIPDGLKDGTVVTEKFGPVFAGTATRMAHGVSAVKFTADKRQLFEVQPVPRISGMVAEDRVLTAVAGDWRTPSAAITYTWRRNGKAITATGATYTLTPSDVGRSISVTATARAANYLSAAKTSVATGVVVSKHPNRMAAGVRLEKGDEIVSSNGKFSLQQRASGSLVLSNRLTGKDLWSNKRMGKGEYTMVTPEGSLATYTAKDVITWTTKTDGRGIVEVGLTFDGKVRLITATGANVWSLN
jgi:surface antigen